MKIGILTLIFSLLLTGCIKKESSNLDLGNGYSLMTTGGSEHWAIWGQISEVFKNETIIIWYKVAMIGVNNHYIVGLRVQGTGPYDLDIKSMKSQPYGYFIINKLTGEKRMGLSKEEANETFSDLNISMSLLKKTSRLYTWKDE